VLHSEIRVSSQLKKNGAFCFTKWNGKNPYKSNLIYLPKHVKVAKGDTVVTSGYNAVYPQGVMVGIVSNVRTDVSVESEERITINLSTDFSNLGYVYLIENKLKPELDSLAIKTTVGNE
jgi:rod shape-determining protein MreC